MKHRIASAAVFGALVCSAVPAAAAEINVPADFATIQAAIDSATDGDTIVVAPGTYTENLTFAGKSLSLVSSDGPATTIIDGAASGSVILLENAEVGVLVEGFTLQNGSGTLFGSNQNGGAVYIGSDAEVTLRGNVLTQNSADDGGGIYSFSALTLENNEISSNTGNGVFVFAAPGDVTLSGNTVTSNTEEGISAFATGPESQVLLTGNVISQNGDQGFTSFVCPNVTAIGNVFSGNAGDGMEVRGGVNVTAEGNVAFDNAARGIYLFDNDNLEAHDNHARNNGEHGIFIWQALTASVSRSSAGGNVEEGIFLFDLDDVVADSLLSAQNADDGVVVNMCANAALSGVTSYGNAGRGLESVNNTSLTVENSIIRGNVLDEIVVVAGTPPAVDSCNVAGGFVGGTNIIDADPLFVDVDGPDDDPATFEDNDYRLQALSPCVDAGALGASCLALDVAGSPRDIDGTLDGTSVPDMGAHEFNNVGLEITGTATPSGPLGVNVSGTSGLAAFLVAALSETPLCIAPFGPIYPDLGTAVFISLGTIPASTSVTVPAGFPIGQSIHFQAGAVLPGTAGNMGNPVTVVTE